MMLQTYINVFGQTGIGVQDVNPNAILEVSSANKGILLTRVALTSASLSSPLASHVSGMILYNTVTAGVNQNKVTPGYYFNDGTRWIRFIDKYQADQNMVVAPNPLIYDTPIVTSSFFSYDSTTGIMTFKEKGNYLVNMQTTFSNAANQAQFILGVQASPYKDYIARGSSFAAKATTGLTEGELVKYTTLIIVSAANYTVKFVAGGSLGKALRDESATGNTNSGKATNIFIQKI